MVRGTIDRHLRRGVADFALALALFWAVALAWGGTHGAAHAVSAPALTKEQISAGTAAAVQPAAARAESGFAAIPANDPSATRHLALLLLSVTVAGIIAFNLAFLRHLRRVYASPRRGVWRRG